MRYTTGMSLAGALATSFPAIVAPAPGIDEGRLLSDSLPSSVLFVSITPIAHDVTAAFEVALRVAHRASTRLVQLL